VLFLHLYCHIFFVFLHPRHSRSLMASILQSGARTFGRRRICQQGQSAVHRQMYVRPCLVPFLASFPRPLLPFHPSTSYDTLAPFLPRRPTPCSYLPLLPLSISYVPTASFTLHLTRLLPHDTHLSSFSSPRHQRRKDILAHPPARVLDGACC
jgi:hypothetical protein